MSILFSVYVLVLFVVLTPGILLRLPKKGSKTTVALVHALVFAAVLAVSGHVFWKHGRQLFEGLEDKSNNPGSNNQEVIMTQSNAVKMKPINKSESKSKSKPKPNAGTSASYTDSKPNAETSTSYTDSKPNAVTSMSYTDSKPNMITSPSSKNPGSN
jgi:hypothetical protein